MANSYTDPSYDAIEAGLERKYNLPTGGMRAIRTRGERSNSDQVSSAGASTVYQIIPSTGAGIKRLYGVDYTKGPAAAAEASALVLRDELKRYGGDWSKAVAAYNGGRRGVTNPALETRNYVKRVTGKPVVVPAGNNGATQLNPEISLDDFSIEELSNMAPVDFGSRRPLGPQKPEDKPSKTDQVTAGLINGRPLDPNDRQSQAPDIQAEVQGQQDARRETKANASLTFRDRFKAASDKNWILNQIVRGMDQDNNPEDPAWHDHYVKNIDVLEKDATSPEERDALRESTSAADYIRIRGENAVNKERDRVINSSGHGTAFEVGAALLDPAMLVATAGVGVAAKAVGIAPTLARTAIEGAGFNMAATGALDFSGGHQDAGDYLTSGIAGLALGAALHPLMNGARKLDTTLTESLTAPAAAAQAERASVQNEARELAGPNATQDMVTAKIPEVQHNRAKSIMDVSLADVGDNNKFLTAEDDKILTGTRTSLKATVNKHGLDALDDAGERAVVAEIVSRSERMVELNPIDEAGLQGRLLATVGQESTGLTMLRSESPVMRAAAMQLTEGTTGAGGRRSTAAMSQVVRERLYMRPMAEYDSMFGMWRKARGIGKFEAMLNNDARKQFDREVYMETLAREGQPAGFRATTDNAVARVADNLEAGHAMMAAEQKSVMTLGSARLPESSRGYIRRVISSREVMRLSPAQRQAVEDVMARQFQKMNEYSYLAKRGNSQGYAEGEKVVKAFDSKFSKKLAKAYLVKAMRRGNGSFDVPVNIHSSEGSDIVQDALRGMKGVDDLEKEAILGRFSRGGATYTKGRLKLDLTESIGEGKVLGDLFNQDIMGLYRGYARRASGEVALAQYGVYGKKGLELIREAAERTGAKPAELKAFDQVSSELLNMPFRDAVRIQSMDNLRVITSAARLGGMAFTQLGEAANGLSALGATRVMSSVASMPRLVKEIRAIVEGKEIANPILKDIDTLGGHLGTDGFQMTRMFDTPDAAVELYNENTIGMMGKAIRGGSHMVAVMSGHRILNAVQVRGMSEQIVRKAIGYIASGKESKALLDMGFTKEIQAELKANLSKIATFDKSGRLGKLDLMAGGLDDRTVMSFRDAVERGAGQIIQRTYTGETGAWAHNDFLKLLFQFRTFSLTSIEKQWGRNQRNYGAIKSFAALMGAMSFALPIHMARLEMQMVGKSQAEKEKMVDERMSAVALGRATLNYASSAGILGDVMDIGSGALASSGLIDADLAKQVTGGGQGRQSASGIVPGLGMVDDLLKGTVGGQYGKLPKLLPGANLPFVTPLVNGLTPDKEQ
jgi:hypothetical protein